MKNLSWLTLIFLTFTLISCSSDKESTVISRDQGALSSLIADVEQIQLEMKRENILTVLAVNDASNLEQTLQNMKVALIRLNENPQDQNALKLLVQELGELKKIPLSQVDRAFLDPFIKKVSLEAKRLMQYQGVEFGEQALETVLYEYRFSRGLGEFTSFDRGNANWVPGWSLDRPLIRINGRFEEKAWLISPILDLTQVSRASLRIYHTMMLNPNRRSNIPFQRNLILENVFKAYASTTYTQDTDPNLDSNWVELPLSGFPLGRDFHSIWSDKISLEQFAGKKVSIALVMNIDTRLVGDHFLMWQLNNFQILGVGSSINFQERVRPVEKTPVYSHTFSLPADQYTQNVVEGNPSRFYSTARNGETYLEISSFPKKNEGVVVLESETIELPKEVATCLELTQVRNFYIALAQERKYLQVLVGKVGAGAQIELDFKEVPSGDNWTVKKSECLSLAAFKGETIQVHFRYESNATDELFPNWQLRKMEIWEETND